MPRGFTRRVSTKPRRSMFWLGAQVNVGIASGGTTLQTIVSEADLENVPNATIVRVRGSLLAVVTASGASVAASTLSVGMYLGDNVAVGVVPPLAIPTLT